MIIELGHFALCLALVLALLQAVLPLLGARYNKAAWMLMGRQASISLCGLVTIAFVALIHAYALSDFSVQNVYQNSHTLKPWLYKITGAWGNHEGSMLLWTWILTFWGLRFQRRGRQLPLVFQAKVIAVQGMLCFGFLLFILLTSNPFLRLDPAPIEGLDLNPILQDPLLAIHPPMLYAGYVGFSVAFCFAIVALLEKKVDAEWAGFLRPWVLAAWSCLTFGIILGATWAYYELGWGGFWFWDPVENASLMPWLAGTALLHSVSTLERRGALKVWTIFLCIFTFSLSLLGTFLVRSGVLTSVHAFAVDPARGIFILTLLTLVTGGALLLYAVRAPYIQMGGSFKPVSRESAILLNNVFLFTFAVTVFMGTLYPLFLSALNLGSISVGAPYFSATLTPLLMPFAALMGFAPALSWREASLGQAARKLRIPFVMAVALAAVVAFLPYPDKVFSTAMFGAAAWILFGTFQDIVRRTNGLSMVRNLSSGFYGMVIAHAGFAVLLMGVTGATVWKEEKILWLTKGDHLTFAGRTVLFLGTEAGIGPNYDYERGIFSVQAGGIGTGYGTGPYFLNPEKRWYPSQEKETSEVSLLPSGLGMLYAVMGEHDTKDQNRWVVRFYYHPLVMLAFGGGVMIGLGGILAARRRRTHVEPPQKTEEKGAA
ncbi:MAG: heme lyase CcmF/NrfE family subunit [Micavibrio sp.]|nr:heme lyase CcmF/NrfE family subunit [Micavibrio sp.]